MTAEVFEDPSDTHEEILGAAYRALCDHGYDDLTMDAIGEEFEKSTSLLYHYYDGKDDLLVGFLGHLLDEYETDVPASEYDDAREHLEAVLDHVLPPAQDDDRRAFVGAMVELRSQAVQDPAYREHFTRSDRFFRERIATIVDRGVEQGVFREVEADRVAAHLLATLHGAMRDRVTADAEGTVPPVREELQAYIERRLLADPGDDDSGVDPSPRERRRSRRDPDGERRDPGEKRTESLDPGGTG